MNYKFLPTNRTILFYRFSSNRYQFSFVFKYSLGRGTKMTDRNEKYIVMVQQHGRGRGGEGIKRDNSRVSYEGNHFKIQYIYRQPIDSGDYEYQRDTFHLVSKDRTVSLFSIKKKKKISIVGPIRFTSKTCRSIYRVSSGMIRSDICETRSKHAFNL